MNDRYYVKLVPESYVIDIGKKEQCFLPFQYNEDDNWVLGEPFFRNFYTIFDDTRSLIGLTPSINFVHSSITEGIVPNDELNYPGRIRPHSDTKKKNADALPSLGDPLSIARYLSAKASKLYQEGVSTTTIAEIVGVLVIICATCCCGFAALFGAGVMAVRYLTAGSPPPQRQNQVNEDAGDLFPDENMSGLLPNSDTAAQKASGPRFLKK